MNKFVVIQNLYNIDGTFMISNVQTLDISEFVSNFNGGAT